jgi:hypothetical protein
VAVISLSYLLCDLVSSVCAAVALMSRLARSMLNCQVRPSTLKRWCPCGLDLNQASASRPRPPYGTAAPDSLGSLGVNRKLVGDISGRQAPLSGRRPTREIAGGDSVPGTGRHPSTFAISSCGTSRRTAGTRSSWLARRSAQKPFGRNYSPTLRTSPGGRCEERLPPCSPTRRDTSTVTMRSS